MDGDQLPEWRALQDRAHAALRCGDWLLRLGTFPSFAAPEVVGISPLPVPAARPRGARQVLVRERTWNLASDAEKFRSPTERQRHPESVLPTIVERSVAVDAGAFDKLLVSLSTVVIPILPATNILGLDGTRFELCATSAMHAFNCHWRNQHPEQWRPLMNWFLETRQLLFSLLEAPSSQPDGSASGPRNAMTHAPRSQA